MWCSSEDRSGLSRLSVTLGEGFLDSGEADRFCSRRTDERGVGTSDETGKERQIKAVKDCGSRGQLTIPVLLANGD
jgi:hypothetical protein